MPNGRPGDHPLTDIFTHGLEAYGPEIDDLIRLIGEMMGREELTVWWQEEIAGLKPQEEMLRNARKKYQALLAERGSEPDGSR